MNYELIKTSAHDTGLDAGSVHTIITSPPYFGLRSYDGDQAVDWPAVDYAPMPGLAEITIPAMSCGLGEEDTPEAFVGHLVLVMREMWRVLRGDGTAWVNLGDSFAANRWYQVKDRTRLYRAGPIRRLLRPSARPHRRHAANDSGTIHMSEYDDEPLTPARPYGIMRL